LRGGAFGHRLGTDVEHRAADRSNSEARVLTSTGLDKAAVDLGAVRARSRELCGISAMLVAEAHRQQVRSQVLRLDRDYRRLCADALRRGPD